MSKIQSVTFKRRYWTIDRAREWLEDNNIKPIKIDETKTLYRFRIINPKKFSKKNIIIELTQFQVKNQ